ncbi:uncharacterized protein IL334_003833 [Kwoniella shivajii]|uniref:F-box domain-containing protein n=1 Tax=Kwoniella shivajii TaxID=564305 RepID=A0ABZ1CZ21_9TREE|nr:hypothetical protein IL334_003833 [Kwoniella shivajii]
MTIKASAKVGHTDDILSQIFDYLPSKSLFAALQVNKTFFHIVTPKLYSKISVKHTGANIFYQHKTSSPVGFPNPLSKLALLGLVKCVNIYVHGREVCPGIKQCGFIPPLPDLKIVHLAGGFQPSDSYVLCEPSTCPFILSICSNVEDRVILREMDFRPLREMNYLKEVVVRLRPCQLDNMTSHQTDPKEPWFTLPKKVEKMKLIWWDERHSYRIESVEVSRRPFRCSRANFNIIFGHYTGYSGTKDCNRCVIREQASLSRTLPPLLTLSEQLPCMMKRFGRATNIKRIDIYNMDKMFQIAFDQNGTTKENLQEMMLDSFQEGRNEYRTVKVVLSAPNDINVSKKHQYTAHSMEDESGLNPCEIYYHPWAAYYPAFAKMHEMDDREEEYWSNRLSPSRELLEARADLLRAFSKGKGSDIMKEEVEFYSQAELEEEFLNIELRRQRLKHLKYGGEILIM